MFRLDGRTAVVTGAGQNMGRGVAETLAAQGAHVLVNDIEPGRAEEVATHIRAEGQSAEAAPFDVTDLTAVQAALQPLMKKDVKVLTRNELAELEVNYWERNSSVGFIFSLGVLVGFVVGSIIVYQILCGDVMNNLPQYATLKAMGYTDSFVIGVVIQQSAILAVIGFVPGVIISMGLYSLLANVTKLTVFMTLTRALQVLILTFVMCVGSGALATRKLVELDPADVF